MAVIFFHSQINLVSKHGLQFHLFLFSFALAFTPFTHYYTQQTLFAKHLAGKYIFVAKATCLSKAPKKQKGNRKQNWLLKKKRPYFQTLFSLRFPKNYESPQTTLKKLLKFYLLFNSSAFSVLRTLKHCDGRFWQRHVEIGSKIDSRGALDGKKLPFYTKDFHRVVPSAPNF